MSNTASSMPLASNDQPCERKQRHRRNEGGILVLSNRSSQSFARGRDTYLLLASQSGFPVPVPSPLPIPPAGASATCPRTGGMSRCLKLPAACCRPVHARGPLLGLRRKLVKSLASGLLIS